MTILTVLDMSCEHCVKRIAACLTELNLDYRIDLSNKQVEIEDLKDNDINDVITALAEIGYVASVVE